MRQILQAFYILLLELDKAACYTVNVRKMRRREEM